MVEECLLNFGWPGALRVRVMRIFRYLVTVAEYAEGLKTDGHTCLDCPGLIREGMHACDRCGGDGDEGVIEDCIHWQQLTGAVYNWNALRGVMTARYIGTGNWSLCWRGREVAKLIVRRKRHRRAIKSVGSRIRRGVVGQPDS